MFGGPKKISVFWPPIQVNTTNMKKSLVLLSTALLALVFSHKAIAQNDDPELINVWQWYNTVDKQYVTVAEGEYQEGQMLAWKWKDKKLLFVAYRNPGPDRVAVYSWSNPVTKDQASIAEDEFTDNQMLKMGYTDKKLQFYAPIRRGPNTIPVYRWRVTKTNDWVNIPDEGDTEAYLKKGYHYKVFQFYGIPRSVDVKIYNQL